MRVKANYANQIGLGGLMFWELSEDVTSGSTSLLDTIYDGCTCQKYEGKKTDED